MLHLDADAASVSRSLEAYLLWLFGYIIFNNGHGNSVDKILIHYAQSIADSEADEDVPSWSWGSAVLAATYHGLCEACMKTDENGLITGCPLLLQLWSYERLAVGRPMVNLAPYEQAFYQHDDADSWPIMGTVWVCSRTVRTLLLYVITCLCIQ